MSVRQTGCSSLAVSQALYQADPRSAFRGISAPAWVRILEHSLNQPWRFGAAHLAAPVALLTPFLPVAHLSAPGAPPVCVGQPPACGPLLLHHRRGAWGRGAGISQRGTLCGCLVCQTMLWRAGFTVYQSVLRGTGLRPKAGGRPAGEEGMVLAGTGTGGLVMYRYTYLLHMRPLS